MQKSVFNTDKRKVLETMIEDIESQIEKRDFDEIPYTASLRQLNKKIGISPRIITRIIKDFLDSQGKSYDHKPCALISGPKYQFIVNRKELKEWKRYVTS
jgi:hypothetical protein